MSQFAAQPTASVMPEELLYGVDGAVATITLNAPQRMNTISGPMLKQLTDALVKANEDRAVRVVILTGTGFSGRDEVPRGQPNLRYIPPADGSAAPGEASPAPSPSPSKTDSTPTPAQDAAGAAPATATPPAAPTP